MRISRPATPPDDPPLGVGDWCQIANHGGMKMLVVDVSDSYVIVGYKKPNGIVMELDLPRAGLRRCVRQP